MELPFNEDPGKYITDRLKTGLRDRFADGASNGLGYLSNPETATTAFNLNGIDLHNNVPRNKFEYFVKININNDSEIRDYMAVYGFSNENGQLEQMQSVIKTVQMPNFSIDSEVLDRYNRKVVSYKKINYTPVDMVFHDVNDSKTLRFWQAYYEYYFKDGISVNKLKPKDFTQTPHNVNDDTVINNRFGYNIEDVGNNKHLINSIEIIQVHGKKYTRAVLVNPKITDFRHDILDYSASTELVELGFTFQPETVIYETDGKINEDDVKKYLPNPGLFMDVAPVFGDSILNTALDKDSNDSSRITSLFSAEIDDENNEKTPRVTFGAVEASSSATLSPSSSLVSNFIDDQQGTISDLVDGVSDDLLHSAADSLARGVATGNFDLSPTPKETLSAFGKNTTRNIVSTRPRDFTTEQRADARNKIRGGTF